MRSRLLVLPAVALVVTLWFGCDNNDAAPPSAPRPDAAAGNAFGQPCLKDGDCASGHCLAGGRCSRACVAPSDCPPGPEWSCAGVCRCVPGPERCDGRDNDCNTLPDDNATCENAWEVCIDGACACPAAQRCGPTPADCVKSPLTDPVHCGRCNNACSVLCSNGACVGATAIAAGEGHACALLADGTVRCWGANGAGQVGDGTTNTALRPVPVKGLTGVVEIALGDDHSCARKSGGEVLCWGSNASGQLGHASTQTCASGPCSMDPRETPGARGAAEIAGGGKHSCARFNDTAKCWGDNEYGQLGDGTTTASSSPVAVAGLTRVAAIALGGQHSCARLEGGGLACWGNNDLGQLGVATPAACDGGACLCSSGVAECSRTPVTVTAATSVTEVTLGAKFTCVARGTMAPMCWGFNFQGQAGNGTFEDQAAPDAVNGVSQATHIAAGASHACAVLPDGKVKCWGDGGNGALGYVPASFCPLEPCSSSAGFVISLADAVAVSAGGRFACVILKTTGGVSCWGKNSGRLGDGERTDRSSPAPVKF